jgi:hypothetical protein
MSFFIFVSFHYCEQACSDLLERETSGIVGLIHLNQKNRHFLLAQAPHSKPLPKVLSGPFDPKSRASASTSLRQFAERCRAAAMRAAARGVAKEVPRSFTRLPLLLLP